MLEFSCFLVCTSAVFEIDLYFTQHNLFPNVMKHLKSATEIEWCSAKSTKADLQTVREGNDTEFALCTFQGEIFSISKH